MSAYRKNLALHLLTNCLTEPTDKYLNFIDICAASGITHLQLRQKNWSTQQLISCGKEIQAILKPHAIPLIINDNLSVALEIGADGVHLGQSDFNPELARNLLGEKKIIGLSIESLDQLEQSQHFIGVDYIAASAVFPSPTKLNLNKIWGLSGLEQFCAQAHHPVVAIGGINQQNLAAVLQAGVSGVALISAIHQAPNPEEYIQQLFIQAKSLAEISNANL